MRPRLSTSWQPAKGGKYKLGFDTAAIRPHDDEIRLWQRYSELGDLEFEDESMNEITNRRCGTLAWFLVFAVAGAVAGGEEAPQRPKFVKQLDLIHFSHTDYGFTDHPAVCRDLQRRYLDVALDTAVTTRESPDDARFRWTAETTIAVNDWWQAATPDRRELFLQTVRAGQIEVSALPLNNTPFLSREQWRTMTGWLPAELGNEFQPQTAIQNDVNGFPRAGAQAVLDRGVRYLFAGINSDSGGALLRGRRPSGGRCPTAGGCLSG